MGRLKSIDVENDILASPKRYARVIDSMKGNSDTSPLKSPVKRRLVESKDELLSPVDRLSPVGPGPGPGPRSLGPSKGVNLLEKLNGLASPKRKPVPSSPSQKEKEAWEGVFGVRGGPKVYGPELKESTGAKLEPLGSNLGPLGLELEPLGPGLEGSIKDDIDHDIISRDIENLAANIPGSLDKVPEQTLEQTRLEQTGGVHTYGEGARPVAGPRPGPKVYGEQRSYLLGESEYDTEYGSTGPGSTGPGAGAGAGAGTSGSSTGDLRQMGRIHIIKQDIEYLAADISNLNPQDMTLLIDKITRNPGITLNINPFSLLKHLENGNKNAVVLAYLVVKYDLVEFSVGQMNRVKEGLVRFGDREDIRDLLR